MAIAPKIELYYDGAWNDITPDVRTRQDIVMTRGYADEGVTASPSSCTLQLRNGSSKVNPAVVGRYSPRNPLSDLYGKIGRNTPLRVRIGTSTRWLSLPGAPNCWASTPDAAALDITGDIDVRVELDPASWRPEKFVIVAAKYASVGVDQRSWLLGINGAGDLPTGFPAAAAGTLSFVWSPDGTFANRFEVASTATVPDDGARRAIRATLDVNNGASGNDVKFYTAPDISGPWTQLGATVTTGGVTAVFSGNASVTVGSVSEGLPFANTVNLDGAVYKAEVRSGIAGTVVANPDFTAPHAGETALTDAVGLAWTLNGAAHITDPSVRLSGEVSNWPSQWSPSGVDAWVPVEVAGIGRRLAQGESPLQSALYRGMTGGNVTTPRAYWPCEVGADSTSIGSALPGHPSMRVSGDVSLAAHSDLASSEAIPTLGSGYLQGAVPGYKFSNFLRCMALVAIPDSITGEPTILYLRTTGSVDRWLLTIDSGGDLRLRALRASDDAEVLNSLVDFNILSKSGLIWIYLQKTGPSTIEWQIGFASVDSANAGVTGGSVTGTLGVANRVICGGLGGDLGGMAVGHVVVLDTDEFWDIVTLAKAWAGETAHSRLVRLCAEEGVPLTMRGSTSEKVGPQRTKTFLTLASEAVAADGGMLGEARDQAALLFRTRASMYNQTPAITLDYETPGHLAPPLEVAEDDQDTRNDITVEREGGSSARAVQTTGPLSSLPPPAGVGRYDHAVTLNLASDGQLEDQAAWRLHLGTVDEPRFPGVKLRLHKEALAAIHDDALAMDIGDRFLISNLPAWLPPDDADQLARGFVERIAPNEHELTLTGAPASPWTVAVVDDGDLGRADTEGSQLTADATSAATTLGVLTTVGPMWTEAAAEFPFDVKVGGELVTVTDIDPLILDTFTRSVSNGWGSATSGQAWTTSGGAAADYSVNGTRGLVSLGSVNVHRRTLLGNSDRDVDISASVATDKVATGNWIVGALLARYVDVFNHYKLQVEFKNDGNVGIGLIKVVAAAGGQIGGHVLGSYAANERFNVRFAIYGSAIGGKIWRVGSPEPEWQIFVVDDDLDAHGAIGTENVLVTGNTNTLPVVLSWDDLTTKAQKFTVTRAVNGVSKAQLAGTDVRLAQPAIAAL